MPVVDYKLRKMNPLENLNGYDLGKVGNATVDYMLSAQIVNGNMGHLWSSNSSIPYHGQCLLKSAKPEQIREALDKLVECVQEAGIKLPK